MTKLRVRKICKEKGITLIALSEKLGINYLSLKRQIDGNPKMSTLENIADKLGVHISDLIEKEDNTMRCPECGCEFIKIEK